MDDPNQELINALMRPSPAGQETTWKTYDPFGTEYEAQQIPPPAIDPLDLLAMRFGLGRGGLAQSALPKGPWTKEAAPKQQPTREWKQAGDDSMGQHLWEAVLGRTRKPGQAVGEPGSGWWMVGNQPIPKPTNVLPWAATGGIAYLANKLWGDPVGDLKHRWDTGMFPEHDPRHPKYDPERTAQSEDARKRMTEGSPEWNAARDREMNDPRWIDYKYGLRYGGPPWWPHEPKDTTLTPLPGAPY